ncbi:hypothetical protein PF005_g22894 [Phytophthora fragariae]|uniref:Uncharacterized protein n=1 Tax=Phytophthora fragariae TaxID=53985 RepID=A0A6A4C8S7_9STRA|nr:hypothetical protein PF003_g23833 [Phytophthora fragariae]KAE8926308.1 hypothetical protein PF009_g23504 [Phytophthora fragariae]KAE9081314.1 hypothetical protein PF007_g22713 [Phytophthora fragariae]KAE9181423.1 hypothetical protein PF005_g22894 [Phytophthora fragariae]KAE9285565.1 hypothetical protein PF001_g21846 [Phytophthora fragariae]
MPSGHTALTYTGVPHKDLVKRVPHFVEYVPQSDKHFATLTTNETLEYANKSWAPGWRRRAPRRPGVQFGHTANLRRPYSQQSPSGHTAQRRNSAIQPTCNGHTASSRPAAIQPRGTILTYS